MLALANAEPQSDPVLHLRSLGQLTADLQRPYASLARAVAVLAIAPALTIDGVAYFDAPAVGRLTRAFAAPAAPRHSQRGAPGAPTRPTAQTASPTRPRRGRRHAHPPKENT